VRAIALFTLLWLLVAPALAQDDNKEDKKDEKKPAAAPSKEPFLWDPKRPAPAKVVVNHEWANESVVTTTKTGTKEDSTDKAQKRSRGHVKLVRDLVSPGDPKTYEPMKERITLETWDVAEDNDHSAALQGAVLDREGDKVTVATKPKKTDPFAEKCLEALLREIPKAPDYQVLEPDHSVKQGDTWQVPLDKLGIQNAVYDEKSNKATLKLVSVSVREGVHWGKIETTIKVKPYPPAEAAAYQKDAVKQITISCERTLDLDRPLFVKVIRKEQAGTRGEQTYGKMSTSVVWVASVSDSISWTEVAPKPAKKDAPDK